MSLTHTLPGALTENSRFRILGATGKLCLESVVTLNFSFCLQRKPNFLRNVRTQYGGRCQASCSLYSVIRQIMMQALRTVGLSCTLVRGQYFYFQPSILPLTFTKRARSLSMKAALGNIQYSTHERNRIAQSIDSIKPYLTVTPWRNTSHTFL